MTHGERIIDQLWLELRRQVGLIESGGRKQAMRDCIDRLEELIDINKPDAKGGAAMTAASESLRMSGD